MLFAELDKMRRNVVMAAIVLVFLGFVFLAVPEAYIPFLGSATAFALVVASIVSILEFLSGPKTLARYLGLVGALALGLIGVLLFVFDDLFMTLLRVLVSAIPIIVGVYGVYHALVFARRSGRRGWWVPLVLSFFLMAFGTVSAINPWDYSVQATLQVMGGTLTFSAMAFALLLVWLWPSSTKEAR